MLTRRQYDFAVIGGGIIGTAIAKILSEQFGQARIILAEKEGQLGKHQSSHNSGVVHSGLYYPSNSLKAKLCVEGVPLIYDYCQKKNIPYKKCGKLVVATDVEEIVRLYELYKNGIENNVPNLKMMKREDMLEIQPDCQGLRGLWSPETGNLNWATLTQSFGQDFKSKGGEIFLNTQINDIKNSDNPSYPVELTLNNHTITSKFCVITTGLNNFFPDSRNKMLNLRVQYKILRPEIKKIRTNLYQVPFPNLPFLGLHISPNVDGSVLLGPSAVPAFKKDGYKSSDFDLDYIKDIATFPGFHRMFFQNFSVCLGQFTRNICDDTLAKVLSKYMKIEKNDILPGPNAVQAQLIDDNGEFADDFLIEFFEGEDIRKFIVNCRFIPSPGATCSLAIANLIVDKLKTIHKKSI